jgi:hypothetical protein
MNMLDRITNTMLEVRDTELEARWAEPESYAPPGEKGSQPVKV